MAKVHANSWEVTDAFWSRVEPQPARDPDDHGRCGHPGR